MNNIRIRLTIKGRVQGVWFRDSTRKQAVDLGVCGWVRNKADGSVEALLEGPEDRVKLLAEWCRHGPVHARVTHVEEITDEYQEDEAFSSFEIVF